MGPLLLVLLLSLALAELSWENGPKHSEKFLFALASNRIRNQDKGIVTFKNTEKFPEVLESITDKTIVIVVMVHTRHIYLRNFLQSLQEVQGIDKAILVLSQDYISNELESLIGSIDFCVYTQIFCPHSTQLHQGRFPGDIDCVVQSDGKKKCVRNGGFPAPKHHWWWKGNFVFDGIPQLKDFNGFVMLLEEDYLVLPDLLHIIPLAAESGYSMCPKCSLMILGAHDHHINYNQNTAIDGRNHKQNIGMVANRKFWNKLKQCAKEFCEHDDYNWDWTLIHVGDLPCFGDGGRAMQTLELKPPRVLHVGSCGLHIQKGNCDPTAEIQSYRSMYKATNAKLFPTKVYAGVVESPHRGPPPKWGGFSDVRDQELCKQSVLKV